MEDFEFLQKRIFRKAALILIFLLVEAVLYQEKLIFFGLLLGALVSVINFLHLAHTFKKVTSEKMVEKKLKPFVSSKYSIRLFLALGVLVLSWRGETKFFIATIIGLLVIKAAIFLEVIQNAIRSYLSNYLSRIKRR